ncbi:MAG: O-antigen ligase family protein [Gemmatimonadetes bacterium]|nr:O-antigen ligase family protein [Gemmatimonadota bacterium]
MEVIVEGVPVRGPAAARAGRGPARWGLLALQVGAVAVVLASVTDKAFELDRFFVPKELALHLTALVAGVLAVGAFRRAGLTRVDLLLVGHLLLGAASAYFAEDRALAARGLAISVSAVAVFWAARGLSEVGLARPLVGALALAVVLGAVTALLQVYGVTTDFFSVNRAPGGTLGNRNFVAHMGAFGVPMVLLVALTARHVAGYLLSAVGMTIVVATLVLTRSRAGWLAFGAAMLVFIATMLLSGSVRRHRRTWGRLAGILLLIGAGVAAAVVLPNSLRWRGENPYLSSAIGIVNYQEGSGRGRLVQYRQSMRMALDHPLLGVGPGNWSVEYPDYAAPGDPSLSRSRPGATSNPWPSSDWVAAIAERGFPAVILLAAALIGIALSAYRRLLAVPDEEEALAAGALCATLLATVVAGLFDAVLLLALPTLLVWGTLGALRSPQEAPVSPTRAKLSMALLIVLATSAGVGAAQSVRQLSRMEILAGARLDRPPLAARGDSRGSARWCGEPTRARPGPTGRTT